MEVYVDASDLASLDFAREESPFDYPTPSVSSDSGTIIKEEEEGSNKKKRKAWGQPVPEIVQILPPRKRAKTAEEKEQRKNERILRNRRAADKSRQRQKAAQAGLEQQNKDLIAENAQLKALLESHGLLSNYHFSPPPSVDLSPEPQFEADTPQPDFSQSIAAPSIIQESPCLAPQVDLEPSSLLSAPVLDTGLTQYPAVVLCDLQCQPILDRKLRQLQPISLVNTVLTLIHYLMISITSSTSTRWQMAQLFQTLELALTTTSTQLESIVLNNFQLIHILISMPSTATQPAIFRMRILSRLLACNPSLAPLLTMAADRALQQRLTEENWMGRAASRWAVASLMTIKWSIQWLNNEHSNIRKQFKDGGVDKHYLAEKEAIGVDCRAVEKNQLLFDDIESDPWVQGVAPSISSSLTPIEVN